MKPPPCLCLIALVAVLSLPAAAGVYRCNLDGHVVYQDSPCPGAQGTAVKLNPNAAPPPLSDQLRAQSQALRDKQAVAAREEAQARQQRLNAILGEITEHGNAARQRLCQSRLIEVQRLERDAAERGRQAYTGNRDDSWRNLARAARERYQMDCR